MAFHIKHDKKIAYIAPLLKLISDEQLKCVEKLHRCTGRCFDPLHPENMMTKHYTWVMPSGNEWFICTQCGAQVHYTSEDDIKIDMLEPELQKEARTDYDAFNNVILNKVKDNVSKHKEHMKEYHRSKKNE
jgi:hypothetical protein